jgi:UPF0755 protein
VVLLNIKLIWHRISEDNTFGTFKKKIKLLVFFLGFLIVLAFIFFSLMLSPKNISDKTNRSFTVKRGMSAKRLAVELEQQGLIKNSFVFNFYAKLKGLDMKIKSGIYMLSPSMTPQEVLNKMVSGDIKSDDIVVTIPEGSTLEQIAGIFEKRNLVSKDDFINTAKIDNYRAKYDFLQDFPNTNLEGLLFPDTYFFRRGEPAEFYIEKMLNRFYEIYYLKNNLKEKEDSLGMYTYQVITIASIIEAEAKLNEEKPIIASVFYNRLKKGMPLQSCATVIYALKEHKEHLATEDLKVDSPYNTYIYAGFPPGPIGSPGFEAISSALNPKTTNYLYFVANGDGSHTFSETYSAHLEAKKRSNQKDK